MRDGLRPNEHHEAGGSPERDDEGAEHRQHHEAGEDPVAAVSARTASKLGRQVTWLHVSQHYTPATAKHLKTDTTAVGCWVKTQQRRVGVCVCHRISSRTARGDASSQARGHVGDPILTTHGIPLPP